MFRSAMLALVAGFALVSSAGAQTTPFAWKKELMLVYRVEDIRSVSDSNDDGKSESNTKLNQTRCWKVLDVDQGGVATMQLWVAAMRFEQVVDGETKLYDSANPEKSDAQMRDQLGKYVNQTLAVLRVDPQGKVLEVKHSQGPAHRWESEPPFLVVFSDKEVRADQAWVRSYSVVLEPPHGTGEKFAAEQKYVCKKLEGPSAVIGVSTAFKSLPQAVGDQVHLLDKQPEGEIVFDTATGCLKSARLTIDKELKNHQGEGSSYHYKSTYTIDKVENN